MKDKINLVIQKTQDAMVHYKKLVEDNQGDWAEDEKVLAEQYLTTLMLNMKALIEFKESFDKDGKYSLHQITNRLSISFMKEQLVPDEHKDEYNKILIDFEQKLAEMKEDKEMTETALQQLDEFADAFFDN